MSPKLEKLLEVSRRMEEEEIAPFAEANIQRTVLVDSEIYKKKRKQQPYFYG